MTRSWQITPGRVLGQKDGVAFFDTDAFPVQFANENDEILLTSQTINFPDFLKGDAYCWQQWDGGGSSVIESAISLVTIPNQEWGPSADLAYITSGCNLSDTVIGTVPALADGSTKFFVKLTRTNGPSNVNGNSVPVMFKEGEWVECYGGSLLVERLYPFARMIQFYLADDDNGDGTRNVLMRRLMSTVKQRQSFYRSGNDYSKEGWNYGGTYGSYYGVPVAQIATKGPTTDVTGIGGRHRRTGSNPASTTDNTDYVSEFTGDIRIVPGRAQITPEGGTGSDGAYFLFTDEDVQSSATTFTFSGKLIGDAASDREVFVSVASYNQGAARSISSVTIAGVTATAVASQMHAPGSFCTYAGLWRASVPTGTTGDVVVTFSGTMTGCEIVVYAGYNMASTTPDATIASTTVNSAANLATVNGGFAISIAQSNYVVWGNFIFFNVDPETLDLDGIENSVLFQCGADSGGSDRVGCRAHQVTDGSTLSINYSQPATPTARAWVAASFH